MYISQLSVGKLAKPAALRSYCHQDSPVSVITSKHMLRKNMKSLLLGLANEECVLHKSSVQI